MEFERPVHPGLAGLVARVVGYHFRPEPTSVLHGIPSPAATVVLSFDEPLDVGHGDERARRWRLATGLHVRLASIRTHGLQHGIQLSLTPAGTRALLGVPMAALATAIADHDDVPLGVPDDLHARLTGATWGVRFALLEEHLLRLAARWRGLCPTTWPRAGRCSGAAADGWASRSWPTRWAGRAGT